MFPQIVAPSAALSCKFVLYAEKSHICLAHPWSDSIFYMNEQEKQDCHAYTQLKIVWPHESVGESGVMPDTVLLDLHKYNTNFTKKHAT